MGVLTVLNDFDRPPTSPQQVQLALTGDGEDGTDWSLALHTNLLLIGNPTGQVVYSFSSASSGNQTPEDAEGTLQGASADEGFGSALAILPGADGASTLLVGASLRDQQVITRQEGAVYVFDGLGAGFEGAQTAAALARLRVYGEDAGGRFGSVVVACADLDGDGVADWLASAPRDNSGTTLAGQVVLALSGTMPTEGSVAAREVGRFWVGTTEGERAGAALHCQTDLTGDGTADLLIGAPFADETDLEASGAIYLLDGAASVSGLLTDAALLTLSGLSDESWLGWSLDTGDIDGDGYPEVVAGAPGAREGTGEVLIWDGAELAVQGQIYPRFRLTGEVAGDAFGQAVRVVDLNADGLGDVVVGAPRHNPLGDEPSGFYSGALYIFAGAADGAGWLPLRVGADADVRLSAARQYLQAGQRLESGDFDGDGQLDLGLLMRADP